MSPKQWKNYIEGASRIFALYVSTLHHITVLTLPPPTRFNSPRLSSFEGIEEPILEGLYSGYPVSRTDLVHITVAAAKDLEHEIWPNDETRVWNRKRAMRH